MSDVTLEQVKQWFDALPDLDTRAEQFFIRDKREFYFVTEMAKSINRHKTAVYGFNTVRVELLKPLVDNLRKSSINKDHLATISADDLMVPLISVTYDNGRNRPVDGYHRICRAMMVGYPVMATWVLNPDQSKYFMMQKVDGNHFRWQGRLFRRNGRI